MKAIQIITTVPTRILARKLARLLVAQKIAACVQIAGPIESVYHWKGKQEVTKEFLCSIKTRKSLFHVVERTIQRMHPYKVPEIIAVPVTAVSRSYVLWLQKETRSR